MWWTRRSSGCFCGSRSRRRRSGSWWRIRCASMAVTPRSPPRAARRMCRTRRASSTPTCSGIRMCGPATPRSHAKSARCTAWAATTCNARPSRSASLPGPRIRKKSRSPETPRVFCNCTGCRSSPTRRPSTEKTDSGRVLAIQSPLLAFRRVRVWRLIALWYSRRYSLLRARDSRSPQGTRPTMRFIRRRVSICIRRSTPRVCIACGCRISRTAARATRRSRWA